VAGRAWVGTSGFSYPSWRGRFYPPDLRPPAMLRFYATRLRTVEINSTFQRWPAPATLARWVRETPEDFRFSVKAHRGITHGRRLAGAEGALADFLASLQPLGARLGAVLLQFPPSLRADRALLEGLLGALPAGARFALELRHPSWDADAVRAALADRGVAWCVADTDEAPAPLDRRPAPLDRTADFAYLRLRRSAYDEAALGRWARAIAGLLEEGADVYCYLRHDEEGRGAEAALRLAAMLSPPQPSASGPSASASSSRAPWPSPPPTP
jgi:uncharacterized protein YecE (DUF72 family)